MIVPQISIYPNTIQLPSRLPRPARLPAEVPPEITLLSPAIYQQQEATLKAGVSFGLHRCRRQICPLVFRNSSTWRQIRVQDAQSRAWALVDVELIW